MHKVKFLALVFIFLTTSAFAQTVKPRIKITSDTSTQCSTTGTIDWTIYNSVNAATLTTGQLSITATTSASVCYKSVALRLQIELLNYIATNFLLEADGTLPSGTGIYPDPWVYVSVATQFSTNSATAVNITGLTFTPAANTKYEFEARLMLRTATATVNPRVGVAWPTGMTDGVAEVVVSQAATGTPLFAFGNSNAALLTAVGGLPNTTQSWPAHVKGFVQAGASPSGALTIQLASETNPTNVFVQAASWLRYRIVP